MAYPAIQFIAAVLIIAALIFILDMLGSKMDPLGLGLTGTSGAILFLVIAFGFVGALLFFFKLSANNVKWRARIEGSLLWVPAWGPAFLNFAMHRFCIALRMTHEAAMRAEKVLHYSFRATADRAFLRGEERAIAVAKKGAEINEAIAASGAPFPEEFLHTVEVAEESGEMSEVMERVAKNHLEEARRQLKMAAQLTSWLIYGLVATLMIIAIFSIATKVYINPINEATRGMWSWILIQAARLAPFLSSL